MWSPFWTPLPPPSHPIPQGHPSAPAVSTLSHASDFDWRSVSHLIIYRIALKHSISFSRVSSQPRDPTHVSCISCIGMQILYHWATRETLKLPMCVCVCVVSCFNRVWLFVTPWTVAHQAPLSLEFSRQEYWSGLLFPFFKIINLFILIGG